MSTLLPILQQTVEISLNTLEYDTFIRKEDILGTLKAYGLARQFSPTTGILQISRKQLQDLERHNPRWALQPRIDATKINHQYLASRFGISHAPIVKQPEHLTNFIVKSSSTATIKVRVVSVVDEKAEDSVRSSLRARH